MRIDSEVEPLVRQALYGAVKRDVDELDRALKAFPTVASRRAGLELIVAITAFVLADLYGGKPPGDQIRALAEQITGLESWSTLTGDEIDGFLTAVVDGRPVEALVSPDAVVVLAFVVAGSLLSAKPTADDDWWYLYLDRIEAEIEAAP